MYIREVDVAKARVENVSNDIHILLENSISESLSKRAETSKSAG